MTLCKYLFKRFFPVFGGALIFFSFLLVLIDVLMNLSRYIAQKVPMAVIGKITLLYIPQTLSWAIPLSLLFAVAFTLSMLYANSEITVIFASGVSLLRFTLPLLVFGIFLSIGFFYFQDKLVIPLYSQKVELQNEVLGRAKTYDNRNVVVLSDGGLTVYKADTYNDKEKRLNNIYIIIRNQDKTLDKIVYSDYAIWNPEYEQWKFSKQLIYVMNDGNLLYKENESFMCTESPEIFKNVTVDVTEVNAREAKAYVEKLKRTGLPYAEAASQYYAKYSFPFVVFIVVFLSIGLTGKSKKNVLMASLISCVSATVIYYVTQMVLMYLARFSYVTPLAGAWFTVILFCFISATLLKFART